MSSERELHWLRFAAAFALGVGLAIVALRAAGHLTPAVGRGPAVIFVTRSRGARETSDGARPVTPVNLDPDRRDPLMRAEHARLRRTEPLLQRLPYRDHELGIELVGATRSGAPVLLVSYAGSERAAREDLRAVLAHVRDRGEEYAVRFRALLTR